MADMRDRLIELLSGCSLDTDEDARYVADKLIAADVAPVVHGRWINKTNPNRAVVEQRVDCSACGHIFWHTSAMSYNYCPNCGADMRGE